MRTTSALCFLLVERERAGIILDMRRIRAPARRASPRSRCRSRDGIPLSSAQQAALLQRLQLATGYTVRLKTRVDERSWAGLVVRVGDKLIDGSVRARLEVLREQLKQTKVT
jgi:F-type H+-transporting ATPase subunit delta